MRPWHIYHELDKNHADLSAESEETNKRMYAMDDEEDCPVKSLKLYLSKLNPACKSLFQRPNIASNPAQWYDRVPVGKVTLGEYMGKLSLEAGCSQRYTNHCIRASTITVLKHSGISESDICSVMGHKREESIKQYCKEPRDVRKRELSTILYKKGKVDGPSSSVDSSPPCSRSSVVTQRVSHCCFLQYQLAGVLSLELEFNTMASALRLIPILILLTVLFKQVLPAILLP